MPGIIKKSLSSLLFILLVGLFLTSKANAASLSNASDTLSTSRPSASAPLSADQAVNANSVTVVDLPGSGFNSALWLASDSATLLPDTGQTIGSAIVASMSASSGNQRTVYFVGQVANTHHRGTAMITGVTAMHTFKFNNSTTIPSGGTIVLQFPTVSSNTASPSATGFSFNGIATSQIVCTPASACAGGKSVSGNTITLTTNASQASGTTIYVAVGCTAINGSGVCTTSSPALVNPIKTTAAAGTNDSWTINISTTDVGGSPVLDNTSVIAGTIEAVQVQGTVQPYITFTISGLSNSTTINTNNSGCTANTDVTNTGIAATATFVNLGSIGTGINIAAQDLTVSTNGNGYTITATSSGRFINPATGFFFPEANGGVLTNIDTPNPAAVTAGTTSFGIHPCGADTYTGVSWGTGTTGGGANARYSNPYNTGTNAYYANLASYSGLPPSARKTTVEYEATAASSVPAGTYTTVFTYVATPIF